LSPLLATELMDKIDQISQEFATSALLVQDSISRAISMSQRAYIMKTGRIVYENTKDALAKMPEKELWDLF